MLNGNVKKLTPQPVTETRFVDSTVESGLTYSYAVTSLDSKGYESLRSAPAAATIPNP
jgi:fibronectin type 3 domain-containing protein